MRNLQDLLLRFSEALRTDVLIKETSSELINEVIGIKIPPENINIKNGVIVLNVSPSKKSEIYLRQEKLLETFELNKLPIKRIVYS